MLFDRSYTAAVLVAVCSCFLPLKVFAQANVRDVAPVQPSVPAKVANAANPVAPAPLATNQAYQIQQLQQEVLVLRGLVEEQAFAIKRLQQQRLDDYLDLDKRLSALSQSGGVSKEQVALPKQSSVDGEDASGQQRAVYQKAIDQLLTQQDYAAALRSFSDYLAKYPEGEYVPNVYYWQGQIFMNQNQATKAAEAFSTLIEQFSQHDKVPDAQYKLARIYFEQGEKVKAKALLQAVASTSSDSARLARSFLETNY